MTEINKTSYPSFFDQILPQVNIAPTNNDEIIVANVEGAKSITSDQLVSKTFEPIIINTNRKPLIIHNKRWYFRLVSSDNNYRARALMDDYHMNDLVQHLVICFTPDYLPGNNKPFRTKDDKQGRLYAYFDSYVEFYHYIQHFRDTERAFFEIIFGELPQKPHFDIDIDTDKMNEFYPHEDMITVSEIIKNATITACLQVFQDLSINFDLNQDILLYSSHGPNKRSFHLVINNKCHDGNKEAKAFYNAVMVKIGIITQGKYTMFVDHSVYSPRQQFRMIGCQKQGSGRPKIFHQQFIYQNNTYQHVYNEDVTDPMIKILTELYESLVGFTAGCTFLPSLIPPKAFNGYDLGKMPDISQDIVQYCMSLLQRKMEESTFIINGREITPTCPFSFRSVKGHLILLKRERTSYCPICKSIKPHEAEHPFIYIVNGKIYWDCRRAEDKPKLFLGYLAMTIDELESGLGFNLMLEYGEDIQEVDEGGEFMFGDFNMGLPTLEPLKKVTNNPMNNISNNVPNAQITNNLHDKLHITTIPVEDRMQNVQDITKKISDDKAKIIDIKTDEFYQQQKIQISNNNNNKNVPWSCGGYLKYNQIQDLPPKYDRKFNPTRGSLKVSNDSNWNAGLK